MSASYEFTHAAQMSNIDDAETLLSGLTDKKFTSLTTVFFGAVISRTNDEGYKVTEFVQANELFLGYEEADESLKAIFANIIGEIIKYSRDSQSEDNYRNHDLENWRQAVERLPDDKNSTALKSQLDQTP